MEAKKSIVQIISFTIIKPSSPTPHNKRDHKLSLLEQTHTTKYGPMIFFYTNPPETFTINSLQKSLSKTLKLFYPFAGRLNDDLTSVECSDQGAYFLEAKISHILPNFLRNPDPETVTKLLPLSDPETLTKATANNVVTLAQITLFSCGGIAIALQLCHKIADGFSLTRFAKTWAAISAGEDDIEPPIFTGSAVLPPPVRPIKRAGQTRQARLKSRMFVFNTTNLAKLKAIIQKKSVINFNITTVEAVSSLLFKCVAEASGPSALIQMVNLRKRLNHLAESNIGHFAWPLIISSGEGENPIKLHEIASFIRRGLSEYFRLCEETRLRGEASFSMVSRFVEQEAELAKAGIELFWFTSLSSFRVYETDFGSGKPAWVTSPVFFDNSFSIMHSKSGQEIEVWVTLEEKVMEKFERNKELLAFASVDVSNNGIGHCRM